MKPGRAHAQTCESALKSFRKGKRTFTALSAHTQTSQRRKAVSVVAKAHPSNAFKDKHKLNGTNTIDKTINTTHDSC